MWKKPPDHLITLLPLRSLKFRAISAKNSKRTNQTTLAHLVILFEFVLTNVVYIVEKGLMWDCFGPNMNSISANIFEEVNNYRKNQANDKLYYSDFENAS